MEKSYISFSSKNNRISELLLNLQVVEAATDVIYVVDSDWVTPLQILPVCVAANKRKLEINIESDSCSDNVKTYLKAIKFPAGVDYNGFQKTSSFLPISYCQAPFYESKINNLATELISFLLDSCKLSARADLRSVLSLGFGELITNIEEHSNAGSAWIVTQSWPQKGEVEFCLVDDGIGIQQSLVNSGKEVTNHQEAVREAIQGMSAKYSSMDLKGNRGHGLGSTVKLISSEELQGRFILISGDAAYARIHRQKPVITGFSYNWGGVIAAGRIKFPKDLVNYCKYTE